jgi:hypothetical protein
MHERAIDGRLLQPIPAETNAFHFVQAAHQA